MLRGLHLLIIAYLVTRMNCFLSQCNDRQPYDHNVTINALPDTVNFYLHDRNNISNHTATVTLHWKLDAEPGDVDGFLIFFKSQKGDLTSITDSLLAKEDVGLPSPATLSKNISYLFNQCTDYFGRAFYVTNDKGKYTKCPFPCADYLNTSCIPYTSNVCNYLNEGYRPIDKNLRNITFPIQFGMGYRFRIYPYKGHSVYYSDSYPDIHDIFIYCLNHLIVNESLPEDISYRYCEENQQIDGSLSASSRITNFTSSFYRDYNRNRTVIEITWTRPHDVVPDGILQLYFVYTNITSAHLATTHTPAKKIEEELVNPVHNFTFEISGIESAHMVQLVVTPYLERNETACALDDRHSCARRGEILEFVLEIPMFDPCKEKNFCDPVAVCNFSGYPQNYTDGCQCPSGYVGDGVNTDVMEKANGCTNFDACIKGRKEVCHSNAICYDAEPPSLTVSTCVCEDGYIGDGFLRGNGCKKLSVILGTSITFGLIFILLIIFAIFLLRRKHRKRLLDSKLTRYFTRSINEYSSVPTDLQTGLTQHVYSINNHNNLNAEPVFGRSLEVERSALQNKELIGRGNFGIVYKAIWVQDGEEKVVAVKSLSEPYTSDYRNEFLAEISLLTYLGNHKNVLGVMGVCTLLSQNCDEEGSTSPLLITEYMTYGDLLHFLWKARDPNKSSQDPAYNFTESSLYRIAQQVACGMHFVSQSKIIHGDLAARNILVGENLQIKISDFGLANDVYRYGFIKGAIERKVPFKWISPERMSGGKMPITWKSDVWSFGILLYEMVTLGSSPYPAMNRLTIFSKLQSGYRMPQPPSCSDYLYKIMKNCWEWDATKRPGFRILEKRLQSETGVDSQQPLLEKIEILNEIDLSSYQRHVERRNSTNTSLDTPEISNTNKLNQNGMNSNQDHSYIRVDQSLWHTNLDSIGYTEIQETDSVQTSV